MTFAASRKQTKSCMQQNYSPKNLLFSQTASGVQKTKFGENNIIRSTKSTELFGESSQTNRLPLSGNFREKKHRRQSRAAECGNTHRSFPTGKTVRLPAGADRTPRKAPLARPPPAAGVTCTLFEQTYIRSKSPCSGARARKTPRARTKGLNSSNNS